MTFLQQRCHILKSIEASATHTKSANVRQASHQPSSSAMKPTNKPTPFNTNSLVTSNTNNTNNNYTNNTKPLACPICEKPHFITQCPDFLNLSPEERLNKTKMLNLCFNCLSSRHSIENCKNSLCRRCNSKHLTLLH
jgi:hypothetical protein